MWETGCYKYTDGSSMIVVDRKDFDECKITGSQCIKEKFIEAPIEATNNQCSFRWEMTQFFNYSEWELLPFKEEIFDVVQTDNKLTLKVRNSSPG